MRPRSLAILLLLTFLAIPNRMAGCLLADAPNSKATESRKSTEIRGRNRINSPASPDASPGIIRQAGGPERPRPVAIGMIDRSGVDDTDIPSPSHRPSAPIHLRLRC